MDDAGDGTGRITYERQGANMGGIGQRISGAGQGVGEGVGIGESVEGAKRITNTERVRDGKGDG